MRNDDAVPVAIEGHQADDRLVRRSAREATDRPLLDLVRLAGTRRA